MKPKKHYVNKWPKINYFGIYDGHGGSQCADFLKNNLHKYIFQNLNFPQDIIKSIKEGCEQAENDFNKIAISTNPIN